MIIIYMTNNLFRFKNLKQIDKKVNRRDNEDKNKLAGFNLQ